MLFSGGRTWTSEVGESSSGKIQGSVCIGQLFVGNSTVLVERLGGKRLAEFSLEPRSTSKKVRL